MSSYAPNPSESVSGEFVTPADTPHLGGYVTGGDPATVFPDLWRWFVEGPLAVKSVLDVGCGDGVALQHFRDLGCYALGIEGVPQGRKNIVEHDFAKGPCPVTASWKRDQFDLVWSCEFVEHVEEQYMPNFLEAFKEGRYVAMTHAAPGQPGWHHVNCRSADYWIGAMATIGYQLDQDITGKARQYAAMNRDPWNHFIRSGMIFRRA